MKKLRIYEKWNRFWDKILFDFRKQKLNNTDFTIICNNCWGGYVYRRYGLPYLSPTIGLYFFSNDFVKLCYNLREYMELPLIFISYTQSKYCDEIVRKKQQNIPIARLGDIEVFFLHYKSEEEAREKWERRVQRINYDNLIFKFSKMNSCSIEDLRRFDKLPYNKKFVFIPPEDGNMNLKSGICFKSARGLEEIKNDTSEYARYINIEKLINSRSVCGKYMEQ